MYIRLLAPFALYAFVFANHYVETSNKSSPFYELPANSTDTLYLVGHSVDLFKWRLTCVRTNYTSRQGEVVNRTLIFNYSKDFNETPEVEMSFPFQVTVPDVPIMFDLELNVTDSLVNYTGAQSTYRIIYYNDESMVLGDKMPTVSERAICSLWVKENFTLEHQIPFMANLSFHTSCKNALYYGYLHTCSK
ncbi:japanin-like isoform X1 [Dermacentor andersoni]|uniref:japanin-like isoform X1 n=1 Tax=Dermacentor andersoni TaxID=34620 RepID=UPI003B3A923A